jgi:hypothetical protein
VDDDAEGRFFGGKQSAWSIGIKPGRIAQERKPQ